MNTLEEIAAALGFAADRRETCPMDRAYAKDKVAATVRASTTTRQIFFDGRTLTRGIGTRYATFPRPDGYLNAVGEAFEELREKHPKTKNRYVTFHPEA